MLSPLLAAGLSVLGAGELDPMLNIEWREGPEYPLGIQEAAMGIVDGKLVAAGGFTRHAKDVVELHPDAFGGAANGFTSIAFALDPDDEAAGWQRIPDVPGPPRQGAGMVVVGDALYAMGGFNYTQPRTHVQTCRLTRRDGQWRWETLLCELPWPATEGSAVAIGERIYYTAAADMFVAPGQENADFHSEAGRNGDPVGQALLMLDTTDLKAGWQRLADCPGTPRFDAGVAAAGGRLYLLGGIFAPVDRAGGPAYSNVIDSWVYDPATDTWSQLPDMPHGANRRAVTYGDRYVILISGYKYGTTRMLDGGVMEVYTDEEQALEWTAFFETTVLVYDTKTGTLGSASPLLERTSWPMACIDMEMVYVLGGEGGRLWHPATFQIGAIKEPQ